MTCAPYSLKVSTLFLKFPFYSHTWKLKRKDFIKIFLSLLVALILFCAFTSILCVRCVWQNRSCTSVPFTSIQAAADAFGGGALKVGCRPVNEGAGQAGLGLSSPAVAELGAQSQEAGLGRSLWCVEPSGSERQREEQHQETAKTYRTEINFVIGFRESRACVCVCVCVCARARRPVKIFVANSSTGY